MFNKQNIRTPIEFVEKGSKEVPIAKISHEINGDTNFAITKPDKITARKVPVWCDVDHIAHFVALSELENQ